MTSGITTADPRHDPRLQRCILLSAPDVAQLIGCSTRTVWRLAACGDIPAPVRLGARLVRWRATDLERHLERLRP